MGSSFDIEAYFSNTVKSLSDDYYTIHNDHCDICMEAELETPLNHGVSRVSDSIESVVVVETPCSHVFHKCCLQRWLISQVDHSRPGTCPKCRYTLITPRPLNLRAHLSLDVVSQLEQRLALEQSLERSAEYRRREFVRRIAGSSDRPQTPATASLVDRAIGAIGRGFRPSPELHRLPQLREILEHGLLATEQSIVVHSLNVARLQREIGRQRQERSTSPPHVNATQAVIVLVDETGILRIES